jgi:hypothetical protein
MPTRKFVTCIHDRNADQLPALFMRQFLIIVWIVCEGIGFCLQDTPVRAEIVDKIVAMLDDELILLSEARECIKNPVARVIANLDASSDIEQDALRYLIEQRLLRREIQYLAFPKETELVRSWATTYIITTYHNKDAQTFAEKVHAQGITDAELEQELTLYMKGIDYIRRKYRFNVDITNPDVVLNLFQQWMKDLQAQAQIHTSFSQDDCPVK